MDTAPFQRHQCWHNERIIQVINTEAVSTDKADFLATHASFTSIREPHALTDRSERELLQELRQCAVDDRHAFMVIQGIPGTGKSHLIRWLKESYELTVKNQHKAEDEVILLIERAQCNLRSTLQQIVQTNVFQGEALHRYQEKLQSAASQLSEATLADTIIDQLRNALREFPPPDDEQLPMHIRKTAKNFLQDSSVREHLQRPNGPIERIKRHLSSADTVRIMEHEVVGFTGDDFTFGDLRGRMERDGCNKDVLNVVKQLSEILESELRNEMARYLNHFLPYAIEHTAALSADELREMFYDLRRDLRKQNRQLTLFIEDITAFIGIDRGLIDVLVTQHTGEGNREFCRLLSVIGVTDAYYQDHFPDNIKERVTHVLTLNTNQSDTSHARLLTTSEATADFAARYLNAIRLDQQQVTSWCEQGAELEQLPNACDSCPWRTPCHAAFGYVKLDTEGTTPQYVGLYPFNQEAIWTMYTHLDRRSRTPRALLSGIVQFVLETHGRQISLGQFPPSNDKLRLGSDFGTPSLLKLPQRTLLQTQSGQNAKRIELLVVFWGNRTIDATLAEGVHLVGGLPEGVFRAFGLPFIEGDKTPASAADDDISFSSADRKASTASAPIAPPPMLPTSGAGPTVQPSTPGKDVVSAVPQRNRYHEAISKWVRREKLTEYEDFTKWLKLLIEAFVDWEAHSISIKQVQERLSPRKITIEDQIGRMDSDALLFKRSDKLVSVLVALADLNTQSSSLPPETVGRYITDLSGWLYEQEAEIVSFVRNPVRQFTPPLSLQQVLLLNCFLLACLQGQLAATIQSQQAILNAILQSCALDEARWRIDSDQAQAVHSQAWTDLMKNIDRQQRQSAHTVHLSRSYLLSSFNRMQGDRGKDVFVLDSALALDILEEFERDGWHLPEFGMIGAPVPEMWKNAVEVYTVLQKSFASALYEDIRMLQEKIVNLKQFVGPATPQEILQAIARWREQMQAFKQPPKLEVYPGGDNTLKLSSAIETIEAISNESEMKKRTLSLSGISPDLKEVNQYLQYLTSFQTEASVWVTDFQRRIAILQEEKQNSPVVLPTTIDEQYNEVEVVLTKLQDK